MTEQQSYEPPYTGEKELMSRFHTDPHGHVEWTDTQLRDEIDVVETLQELHHGPERLASLAIRHALADKELGWRRQKPTPRIIGRRAMYGA